MIVRQRFTSFLLFNKVAKPPSYICRRCRAQYSTDGNNAQKVDDYKSTKLQAIREQGLPLYTRIDLQRYRVVPKGIPDLVSAKESEKRTDPLKASIRGRIISIRIHGKIAFVDVLAEGHTAQVVYDVRRLNYSPSASAGELLKAFGRGDSIEITGNLERTSTGQPSLFADSAPKMLSPCLKVLPVKIDDTESRFTERHRDLFVNGGARETLLLRSKIINSMRNALLADEFTEVQTPMLSQKASGALARPFATGATYLPDKELQLRIAPELWLKRLVVGGIDRVFELGTCFRNESTDTTHNPEFTSLEFYSAYTNIDGLYLLTERVLKAAASAVEAYYEDQASAALGKRPNSSITAGSEVGSAAWLFENGPFRQFLKLRNVPVLDFVGMLENALGRPLPNLSPHSNVNLRSELLEIYRTVEGHASLEESPLTVPHILDKLADFLITPQIVKQGSPCYIQNHPACMSPLAKSSIVNGREVSMRFELIAPSGMELLNAYEEENSPVEQRRKFEEQTHFRLEAGDLSEPYVDESYLNALEYGLPPTGGWGLGVDRLIMALLGKSHIREVLSFGSLNAVLRATADKPSKVNVAKVH